MEKVIKMKFKVSKELDKISKTVRIEDQDCKLIEKLAKENRCSFNAIVNSMIKYAIENM